MTTPLRAPAHARLLTAALLLLALPAAARAQWTQPAPGTVSTAGSVGIGTNAPASALDVVGPNKSVGNGNANQFIFSNDTAAKDFGGSLALGGRYNPANGGVMPFGYVWGRKEADGNGENGYLAFGTRHEGGPGEWVRITSGGRVGIGTTSPQGTLHVDVNGWGAAGDIRVSGTAGGFAGFQDKSAAADRKLYQWRSEGGLFRMSLLKDSDGSFAQKDILVANWAGNVGLGTAAPVVRLQVKGTTVTGFTEGTQEDWGARSLLLTRRQPNDLIANIGFDPMSTFRGALEFDGLTGKLQWWVKGAGAWANTLTVGGDGRLDVAGVVNASQGLCINGVCKGDWSQVGGSGQWASAGGGSVIHYDAGKVGVGTASPVERLTVAEGNLYAGGADEWSSGAVRLVNANAGAAWRVAACDGNPDAGCPAGGLVVHQDAVATRMAFTPGGNVGIGTTTPEHTLDVKGTINASEEITGKTINATFQDVAEWVPSTQKLRAGTVVVLDGGRVNHVQASGKAYDTKVAGVVSESPGVILGVAGEGKLKVATTGRVKVRVDATREAVEVGDLLVTSGVEGVAMKSVPVDLGGVQFHRPGTIIGKALEPLEKGVGEILVLLSLQ